MMANESGGILDMLKSFDKSNLKKTKTRVTNEAGEQHVEYTNEHGITVTEKEGIRGAGFVIDQFADLQVGEVLPGLILGSQDVAADLDILQQYKVTHILNMASYVKNIYHDKFTYKNIEMMDIPQTHILPYFDEAFEFITSGISQGCVLVHCNAGVSRSATVVIAYLMKNKGWSLQKAYQHVKEKRPKISPNAGFQSQLETYEERLMEAGIINKSQN